MALPILNTPKFEVELPLSKKTIAYRPFLVKEEKILLMALESQDTKQIVRAMNDIVESCTFNEVRAKDLSVPELEYLFLKLRAKSVGEISHIGLKCSSCGETHEMDIDLDSITLDGSITPEKKIMLTDSVGVLMKYPSSDNVLKNIGKTTTDIETTYSIVAACLDKIFDADNVYEVADQTKEEVQAFIESLSKKQFEKIQNFFDGIPRLKQDVSFKCGKCGTNNNTTLEGMESFFA